jgi:hypothetical protein
MFLATTSTICVEIWEIFLNFGLILVIKNLKKY